MSPSKSRRRLLALSTSGLAALAGCQSVGTLGTETPIQISVMNGTTERIEVWIQLEGEDEGDPFAESIQMDGKTVDVFELSVPNGSYSLTVIVDDRDPSLKRRIEWEITGRSCSTNGLVTISSREGSMEILLDAQTCDEA